MRQRETQGASLRAWREDEEISQKAAGERLADFNDEQRGATQAAWAAWERGEKSPDLFFAFAIERMTNGKVTAQAWAVSRRVKPPTDSETVLTEDADLHDRVAG